MHTDHTPQPLPPAADASQPPADPQHPPRPRLWTAIAGFVGIALAGFVTTNLAIIAVAIGLMIVGRGKSPDMDALLEEPAMLAVLILVSQATWGLLALLAARLSRQGTSKRLGLRRPGLSPRMWLLAIAGTFSVNQVFVVAVLSGMISPGAPGEIEAVYAARGGMAVLLVLMVGLFPGLCEELLFRGFLQRRLVERLGPVAGIGLTAAVFGLVHLQSVQYVTVVFAIGLWLGVLAWRTGSVWPSVVCHAVHNLVLVGLGFLGEGDAGAAEAEAVPLGAWAVLVTLTGLSLLAAAITLRGLFRRPVPM